MKHRVATVNTGCRSAPGTRRGAMRMPRPALTIEPPTLRALASFARSPGTWVMAPAREP